MVMGSAEREGVGDEEGEGAGLEEEAPASGARTAMSPRLTNITISAIGNLMLDRGDPWSRGFATSSSLIRDNIRTT